MIIFQKDGGRVLFLHFYRWNPLIYEKHLMKTKSHINKQKTAQWRQPVTLCFSFTKYCRRVRQIRLLRESGQCRLSTRHGRYDSGIDSHRPPRLFQLLSNQPASPTDGAKTQWNKKEPRQQKTWSRYSLYPVQCMMRQWHSANIDLQTDSSSTCSLCRRLLVATVLLLPASRHGVRRVGGKSPGGVSQRAETAPGVSAARQQEWGTADWRRVNGRRHWLDWVYCGWVAL